jgi:alcohol dehydrogenase class IV
VRSFDYDQPASRVIFGAGAFDRIAGEVQRLGARRAIVVGTPGRRKDVEEAVRRLGNMAAAFFAQPVTHVPIETARAACEAAKRHEADCCVAIGGGSTVGIGKAIALETGLPVVAVPTTYAGSEMTPVYGFTEGGLKRTGRDQKVLPKVVLYDPVLTLALPPKISGPSGMNALAHCVVGLYAENINPVITLFAAEGIRSLGRSLPAVVGEPANLDARTDALYGAWMAGSVLRSVGMSIHYKLCHVLGGTFSLPHGEVHTVILPHAVAFNREAAPEAMRIAAEALDAPDAAQGIYDLALNIGAPVALKDIGMPLDGLDRAARLVMENPYYNPRPVEYSAIRQLLEHAYRGDRPE